MSISAINPIANMQYAEYLLYGGRSGGSSNCPSYTNGYMSMPSYASYSPYSNYAGYYNQSFRGGPTGYLQNSLQDTYTPSYQGVSQVSGNETQTAFGAAKGDLDVLGNYYIEGLAPSESLAGAAFGGVTFAMMNNPRTVVHPWNFFLKATKATDKVFAGIKTEGSSLYKLWRNPETTNIMQEAYSRMHKLEALNNSKLGLFRKRIDSTRYKELKKVMEDALKFTGSESDKVKKIAEATELIKKETNAFTGHIPNLFRKMGLQKPMQWLRGKINESQYKPVSEVAAKNIAENGKALTFAKSMKHCCSIKSGGFFALIELIMGMGGVIDAFGVQNMSQQERVKAGLGDKKYHNAGWKQLGQTLTKAIGNAAGWCIGEGIGAWAGAKLGAWAGTAIAPGVGTAIGAVAGLVGGSIGMWLMGKATHKLAGQDISEQIKVDKMKATPEGQAKLLELTMERAQNDKNLDAKTAQAIQNVYSVYA